MPYKLSTTKKKRIINLQTLKQFVVQEYDNRNLKSEVRYKALDKIVNFLGRRYGYGIDCLSKGKEVLKLEYEKDKKKVLNSAEKSAFNELFNQFCLHKNECVTNTNNKKEENFVVLSTHQNDRDETYVMNLCDEALNLKALRQHRFSFLVGDTGIQLPVDAYYKEINLVVEYCERQHTESVPLFDRRMTASGVSRDKQRRIYDERRREVLPKHGIKLVNISYSDFEYDSNKRIVRDHQRDIMIVKKVLGI